MVHWRRNVSPILPSKSNKIQYATAVGLSDLLEGRISHDKITRFLNGKEFASKELWEHIKPEIRKIEQDTGECLFLMTLSKRRPTQMKMR
jgi:hypothetical protein